MESSLAFKEERIFALDKFQFPLEGYESFLVNVIRGLSHFSKGYVSSAEPPHGATNSFADLPSSFRLVGELRFDMSDSLKTRRVGQREQVEILCDSESDTGRITNENCQKSISRCLDLFAGELDNRFPGRVGAIPINCGVARIDLGRGNHGLSFPYCNISGFELGIYFEIPKGFYSGQVSLVNKGLMIGHPRGDDTPYSTFSGLGIKLGISNSVGPTSELRKTMNYLMDITRNHFKPGEVVELSAFTNDS